MQINQRPLLFFAWSKPDILEALLEGGAEADLPQTTPEDHWTALMLAAMKNDADAIEILLKHGADPNLRDARGNTALPLAATFGRTGRKAFESLLELHADPNIRNNDGATPLSIVLKWHTSAAGDEVTALLRQHGALDQLPDWDHITVSRASARFSKAILAKGTNDWNQFTLLELIAVQCQFLAASPNERISLRGEFRGGGSQPSQQPLRQFFGSQWLGFPDLGHLRIRRAALNSKNAGEQTIDLTPMLESGDCSHDLPLQWGDVVEIPETDHPLSAAWNGFSKLELTNLDKCLTRHVNIIIKGEVHAITLALGIRFHNPFCHIGAAISKASFWLGPVLEQSQLILASSDLAHVKVTRRNPQMGRTNARTMDCSRINESGSFPVNGNPAYLWLRDGDVIEIPEKP